MRLRVKIRNVLWDRREQYAFPIPEFIEYEGDVVEKPKWVTGEQFCLSTGDKSFPFRVIEKEAIVCGYQMSDSPIIPRPVDKVKRRYWA